MNLYAFDIDHTLEVSGGPISVESMRKLAAEGKLRAYRHEGVWLTVNTPKDLRKAEEFMDEHPEWRPRRRNA